jgi:uncharacterized spore protein YtfJ
MTSKPITIPPVIPPAMAPIGELLSLDAICGSSRGVTGCSNTGMVMGDAVCIDGTIVIVVEGVRVGDTVSIDGVCTGEPEFDKVGELVTGVGADTGANVGAEGTLVMVKHSSVASCSQ